MNAKNLKEKLTNVVLRSDDEELRLSIEEQNTSDPDVITALLEVTKDIVDRFVIPASSLLCQNEDGWTFWDLDKLAGYEYPGLISGALKLRFPELSVGPPHALLEKELQLAGFQISSSKQQSEFFTGWVATRAISSLHILAEFLYMIDLSYDKYQLDILEELVLSDVSGSLRFMLAKLLKKCSPKRAHVTGTIVKEKYLQELLCESS